MWRHLKALLLVSFKPQTSPKKSQFLPIQVEGFSSPSLPPPPRWPFSPPQTLHRLHSQAIQLVPPWCDDPLGIWERSPSLLGAKRASPPWSVTCPRLGGGQTSTSTSPPGLSLHLLPVLTPPVALSNRTKSSLFTHSAFLSFLFQMGLHPSPGFKICLTWTQYF